MEPLLLFPDPPSEVLTETLDQAGYPWKAAATPDMATRIEPEEGWAGAVIDATRDPEAAFGLCRVLRKRDIPLEPLLLLVPAQHIADLELREDLFDDFCVTPSTTVELEARLKHLFWRSGGGTRPSSSSTACSCSTSRPTRPRSRVVRSTSPTWSTSSSKYLASHPGKVFTRETLLSRVWGYEYYGGARTVDVHIRRLRAKLGEEHANLIQTVRSVGYRFGQSPLGRLIPRSA